jgi:hypothetical protein
MTEARHIGFFFCPLLPPSRLVVRSDPKDRVSNHEASGVAGFALRDAAFGGFSG